MREQIIAAACWYKTDYAYVAGSLLTKCSDSAPANGTVDADNKFFPLMTIG